MEKMTFKVRPTKKAEFDKLMKKLNRCLLASGLREVYPTYIGKCDIRLHISATNLSYNVEGDEYEITLPDEVIGMKGYKFIGEYRKVDGKWYRTMHSTDVKDELEVNERNMRCDHCGKNIKNRNGYFYFRNEENELKVVGSTCVDAFFGYKVFDILKTLGDATIWERTAGSVDLDKETVGIGIDSFVSLVSYATNGFTKWKRVNRQKNMLDDDSTSCQLKIAINNAFFGRSNLVVPELPNTNEIVAKCREYWESQFVFDDLSVNSRKALSGDYVPLKWAGIAGWAVYKAVTTDMKKQQPKTSNGYYGGRFVGEVGDAMTAILTVMRYMPFVNKWGRKSYAIHLEDEQRNHFLLFTNTREFLEKAGLGKPVKMNFKIYGREVSRGENVNKINSVEFC